MRCILKAVPLESDHIDLAYPLVVTLHPSLSLEAWRLYADRLISGNDAPTGIVTVRNPFGTIQGLASYLRRPTLSSGDVLQVDDLIALDLIDPDSISRALMDALAQIGRTLGCHAVCYCLPSDQKGVAGATLQSIRNGLDGAVVGTTYRKSLALWKYSQA